ncbi:MAG TPA: prolyl oligopeptidase family serine peptidase, partial [bacterium]
MKQKHLTGIAFKAFVTICVLLIQSPIILDCSNDDNTSNNSDTILPTGYENRYYEGMRYGLFVPPSYDSTISYPLIIGLHGSTDTVSWDLGWYHDPIQSTDPCFVLTPKSLVANNGWGNSWMTGYSEHMKKTLEITDSLIVTFNIDTNRLYIYGTSMGGFGVFSVLTNEPGKFAGAFS